jgi:hypothetical protein
LGFSRLEETNLCAQEIYQIRGKSAKELRRKAEKAAFRRDRGRPKIFSAEF